MNCPKCQKMIPDEVSSCIFCGVQFSTGAPNGATPRIGGGHGIDEAQAALGARKYKVIMSLLSVFTVALVVVMLAMVLGSKGTATKKQLQNTCFGNLHDIGVAIDSYAQDHQGTFPTADAAWTSVTYKTPDMLVCPAVKSNPSAVSYGYNAWIGGHGLREFLSPDTLPLVADANNKTINSMSDLALARHKGVFKDVDYKEQIGEGYNVVYASGSVEWVKSARNLAFKQDTAAPISPVPAPASPLAAPSAPATAPASPVTK